MVVSLLIAVAGCESDEPDDRPCAERLFGFAICTDGVVEFHGAGCVDDPPLSTYECTDGCMDAPPLDDVPYFDLMKSQCAEYWEEGGPGQALLDALGAGGAAGAGPVLSGSGRSGSAGARN
jgi:hypothetical protein